MARLLLLAGAALMLPVSSADAACFVSGPVASTSARPDAASSTMSGRYAAGQWRGRPTPTCPHDLSVASGIDRQPPLPLAVLGRFRHRLAHDRRRFAKKLSAP